MAIQRTGATTPSEKFSARLSIAARATPAASSGAVSRPTICDTALRAAPGCLGFASAGGDVGHVPIQAALREQWAGGEGRGHDADGPVRNSSRSTMKATAPTTAMRITTAATPAARRALLCGFAIERAVECTDEAADPGHRMADRAHHGCG